MFSYFKTDTRQGSRDCKLMDDGRYMYRVWNSEAGAYERIYIGPEDGVTDEMIRVLREFDESERLTDRYEDELKDEWYELELKRDPKGAIFGYRALEVPDPEVEPERILFREEIDTDPNTEAVGRAIAELTPAQQDLIRDLFGLLISQVDIAKRDHVSKQAINNRKNKMICRLEDLLYGNVDL